MTASLQTCAKITSGQNISMPCFLQVYAWKSFETEDNLPLNKKPKPDSHLKCMFLQKKCRTEIRGLKVYCFHQFNES